jgi:hypothetical protein
MFANLFRSKLVDRLEERRRCLATIGVGMVRGAETNSLERAGSV